VVMMMFLFSCIFLIWGRRKRERKIYVYVYVIILLVFIIFIVIIYYYFCFSQHPTKVVVLNGTSYSAVCTSVKLAYPLIYTIFGESESHARSDSASLNTLSPLNDDDDDDNNNSGNNNEMSGENKNMVRIFEPTNV
jgi:hypothetical protein